MQITRLPDLPFVSGYANPGVAGAFAGVSNGVLLLAGGANFPNGYPWEGGQKVWQTAIYALSLKPKANIWQPAGHLGHPLAYGASVSWRNQLIIIGGNDAQRRYTDVIALRWEAPAHRIRVDTLPPLPLPLANLSAACSHDFLYVFGGESENGAARSLYVLNLRQSKTGWQKKADLPGPARAYSTLLAAHGHLYVAGGRFTNSGQTHVLADAYAYTIANNRWQRLPDLPSPLSAHGAVLVLNQTICVVGGDTGERLRQIEQLNNQLATLSPGSVRDSLTTRRNALQRDHPGFSRTVWAYRPGTKQWIRWDELPFVVPVTTPIVAMPDGFIVVSGEVSPGVRTPSNWRISFQQGH